MFITANPPNALYLEEDDRRFFVHRAPARREPEFYTSIKLWKQGDGPAALFHYLLNIDLGGFNPDAPAPMTAAKLEVLSHGRTPMADWAVSAVHDPDSVLTAGSNKPQTFCLYSAEELFGLFVLQRCEGIAGRYTALALGRELRAAGAAPANGNMVVRTREGQKRLWIMRDVERLSKLSGTKLGEMYDQERGKTDAPATGRRRKF